jgi:hypothetical protein
MSFLNSVGKFLETMNEGLQKETARINEAKDTYRGFNDQQLLNELMAIEKSGDWRKISALKTLLTERGYTHVGNGYYQKQ